ncbi:MAG: sulfurtransferase TusA [Pseudomonadota bacterium]
MNEAPEFQHEVDARGLRCPEPVMLLHARLRKMPAGETVRVLADDPSTTRDIPKLCEHLGHGLLHREETGGEYRYWIRKRS